MTLTKADIADSIFNQCGFSGTESVRLIETTLEILKRALESGDDVMLSRFGKFSVRNKKARRGRNPATGKNLILVGQENSDLSMLACSEGEVEWERVSARLRERTL